MSYIGYRSEDGTLYSESAIEEMFDDMLNEVYPAVGIAGLEYSPAYALEAVDPTAYRVALGDYMSEYAEESFDDFDEYMEALEA